MRIVRSKPESLRAKVSAISDKEAAIATTRFAQRRPQRRPLRATTSGRTIRGLLARRRSQQVSPDSQSASLSQDSLSFDLPAQLASNTAARIVVHLWFSFVILPHRVPCKAITLAWIKVRKPICVSVVRLSDATIWSRRRSGVCEHGELPHVRVRRAQRSSRSVAVWPLFTEPGCDRRSGCEDHPTGPENPS
jgi:hypothetical protein